MSKQAILLFDGLCNLCDRSVNFVINHDSKDIFRFASQQSAIGSSLLKQYKLENIKLDTMVLIYQDKTYLKSTAVLKMLSLLGFPYSFSMVLYLIPRFLRDDFYMFIANNRYQWFGKYTACKIPSPEIQKKFLV